STNTINLQEQLAGKDLPFLARALGEEVRFALVKGRGNYVSIRRALLARDTAGVLFDEGRRTELERIVAWLGETREGSLQDLGFQPSSEVWDEVVSETDVCLRARCPHFEACHYQRARRAAASADVLVVNHHLLFSDLAVRRAAGNWTGPAVLPPYRRIVLDEAHNLEDAATQHLGATLSRRGLYRLLGRLERRGRGLLPALEARLAAAEPDLLTRAALPEIQGELRPGVEHAREHGGELFRRLGLLLQRSPSGVQRIDGELQRDGAWAGVVEPALEDLATVREGLARSLERLCERIALDGRWAERLEEQLLELRAAASRARSAVAALRMALGASEGEVRMVRWIERRGAGGAEADRGGAEDDGSRSTAPASGEPSEPAGGRPTTESLRDAVAALRAADPLAGNVTVRAAPVDLAGLLRDALFERVETAILTSATLTTRDGFGFLRDRLGLSGGGLRYGEATFPSPFAFDEQALVVVPTDLPPVRAASGAFDARTAEVTLDLAKVTDGGLMVLFTSYRSLRRVAVELRGRGVERRWPLFVQGEAARGRLLEGFTASGRAVLLGVASFWEGVDVPGDPLRGLIIAKLPFLVPDEPVTAARAEAVERDGRSAFGHYMLPHAALRLKQGFGRLIRSRADRGAVVLLDGRLLERSYGRYMLDSLPPAPVLAVPWDTALEELARFYGVSTRSVGVAP
ncbi:MAG TPA: helicase C-terminal domain-containing protein, partial [Longimicrobiales bacterium]|nr:helicase C-terminal domain-containing protein [Longimicrobiales bacterium]